MLEKIGVVGGGMIGGVLVQEIGRRRLARAVGLVDIMPPDLAKGKCLDIPEGSPLVGIDCRVEARKAYEALAGADLVINTAGVPRKPRPDGTFPSREELLATNLKITDAVADGIKHALPRRDRSLDRQPARRDRLPAAPEARTPKNRILGMAGVLDSARYRYFVAQAAGVRSRTSSAMVLGGHGDDMVPIRRCRIAGMPVEQFIDADEARRDRGPHPQGGRRGRQASSAPARPSSRRPARRWRWPRHHLRQEEDPRRCATSRASTASTACSSASRRSSAQTASRR